MSAGGVTGEGTNTMHAYLPKNPRTKKLTDIIDSNHHRPTSTRGSVGYQVKLVVHIDGIHRAELRNLRETLLLQMSPHLLQYFREAMQSDN